MKDKDIIRLRKVLRQKGRYDLSELLIYSTSKLNETGSYGSRWYSTLSSFEIKSPPNIHEKILNLSEEDKQEIFNALILVYPLKDNEPEITNIEYFPDYELEEISLVETPKLEKINFDYIHQQINKCSVKIAEKDHEGAITNARTLIESVCLYILEKSLTTKQNYNGDLIKLYKTVATTLNMSPSEYSDDNIKQILSGSFTIINGIAGLRNEHSDSHGSSPLDLNYKIDESHAILAVNIAKSISEFLFMSFEKKYHDN